MQDIQGYAAIAPVMPAAGNHERVAQRYRPQPARPPEALTVDKPLANP
jgi:hypothetical protein